MSSGPSSDVLAPSTDICARPLIEASLLQNRWRAVVRQSKDVIAGAPLRGEIGKTEQPALRTPTMKVQYVIVSMVRRSEHHTT